MPLSWGKQKQKYYWDFIKFKSFCKVKETSNAKMQHTKWEEIFVNNTSNKELVCKIRKANINLSILNTNYPTTDGQKRWMDFVSDKTSRWPPDTRRDTQRHPSSGKCNPQWDVTWQPSEWLKLTTEETTGVVEAMEKREPLTLLVGMRTGAATVENTVGGPRDVKNRGSLGGAAVWHLPLAHVVILDTRDQIPRRTHSAWIMLLPLLLSLPFSPWLS